MNVKQILSIVGLALVLNQSSIAQNVTITFGAGDFYSTWDTSTKVLIGARVNILALESGSWTNIQSTLQNLTNSFTPSGAVLVAEFATNNDAGDGTVGTSFAFTYSDEFNAGDELLMVVYPSLTMASTSPGTNTSGFWFRTNSIIDGSDIGWVAPAPGSYGLYAYTLAQGGSVANNQFTSGDAAAGGSGFTTVPEPGSALLLGLGGVGLYFFRLRQFARLRSKR
jgi:hypothetical protein